MPAASAPGSAKRSPLVDFAIAGAQKCGTTAIMQMLSRHPDVYMLPKTRHNYFVYMPLAFSPWARWGYERDFKPAAHHSLIGESSSSYLFYPHALKGLKRYNPAMKLIVSVRHPVARAFSHWNMNAAKGIDTRTFADAVRDEMAGRLIGRRRYRFGYLERGLYGRQIDRLLQIFPRQQVLILHSQDTLADPQSAWARLLELLDLPVTPPPKRHVWNARTYISRLDEYTEARLSDYFAADIDLLCRLSGYDFSVWRSPAAGTGEPTATLA